MIEILTIRSGHESHRFAVSASGSKLTVSKGAFKVGAEEGSIADDYEYTLTRRTVKADVSGYLVKNRRTGEYEILVDEVEADGADLPHDFETGDYAELSLLFWAVVPADTNLFDSVQIKVNHLIPKPAPPPRAPGPPTPQEGGAP